MTTALKKQGWSDREIVDLAKAYLNLIRSGGNTSMTLEEFGRMIKRLQEAANDNWTPRR